MEEEERGLLCARGRARVKEDGHLYFGMGRRMTPLPRPTFPRPSIYPSIHTHTHTHTHIHTELSHPNCGRCESNLQLTRGDLNASPDSVVTFNIVLKDKQRGIILI